MSPKLALIASLATVSVAGISTGGYFLLKGNSEETSTDSKPIADGQKNGDEAGVGKATNGEVEGAGNTGASESPQAGGKSTGTGVGSPAAA